LLIAGDLFDDLEVDQLTARRAFEMLEAAPLPVYVLPGNHDPLIPGGVWDRHPWNKPAGNALCLLRERKALEVTPGLVLLPCPVFRKTSLDDPTAWLTDSPVGDSEIRIGIAHGSLKIRDDLPLDDHLIGRNAVDGLGWDSRQE